MTTEKMRVRASSVIRSVAETSAMARRSRQDGRGSDDDMDTKSIRPADRLRQGDGGPPKLHAKAEPSRYVAVSLRRAFVAASITWAVALPLAAAAAATSHHAPGELA